jgi:endonuclease YncB( thermonuclease family)
MKTTALLAAACLLFLTRVSPAADEGPAVNYTYNAKVSRVLAGDIVALDVDLGFGVWLHNQPFKLQGVTAPALDGPDKPEALKAKTKTQEVLMVGEEVVLQSVKDKTDKTNTYHAVLWKDGANLNEEIVKGGAGK